MRSHLRILNLIFRSLASRKDPEQNINNSWTETSTSGVKPSPKSTFLGSQWCGGFCPCCLCKKSLGESYVLIKLGALLTVLTRVFIPLLTIVLHGKTTYTSVFNYGLHDYFSITANDNCCRNVFSNKRNRFVYNYLFIVNIWRNINSWARFSLVNCLLNSTSNILSSLPFRSYNQKIDSWITASDRSKSRIGSTLFIIKEGLKLKILQSIVHIYISSLAVSTIS